MSDGNGLGGSVFCRERWNSWICGRPPDAKALIKDVSVNQERKLGDRRRSDTVVVPTINYASWGLVDVYMTHQHSVGNQAFGPGEVWSQGWNLKKLTGIHLQARSMWLNLTQHGETYQVQTRLGLTDWQLFLDCVNSGAWPVLVGEVICLVNSVNERDLCLLNSRYQFRLVINFLEDSLSTSDRKLKATRSVMPLDVLGCTRATLASSASFMPDLKGMGNLFKTCRAWDRCLQLFIFNGIAL